MGWKVYGNIQLKDDGPFERNPHQATLTTYKVDSIDGENLLYAPTKYIPQSVDLVVDGVSLEVEVAAKSFAMYRIKR